MKAIVYTQYGPPDVLKIKEVPKPEPKADEVLIKIRATTVNRTDTGFRKPEYFIVRLVGGFFKPKRTIQGSEFAGEIEAAGKDVTSFKVGDAVFGLSTLKFGTHAQYICISETGAIAHKPVNLNFNEAAAICEGLYLAINYIRKISFINKPKILVNGATGSIGSACVQLAKYYGGHVTAVCNTKNLALIKSLGADVLIDYTKEDFTKSSEFFDVVLDAVGKSSFFKCKNIMKPGAFYFSTELGYLSQNVFLGLLTPLLSKLPGGKTRKKVLFPVPTVRKEDIEFFKELIESGNYKPVIDRVYPLEQIIEATKYVETGEKTGNVVITISH